LTGEYYAHVTLVPFGLECTMAIDEACTDVSVQVPCEALVLYFVGEAHINSDVGVAPFHEGEKGV
jgi:hypothetical protein